MTRSDLLQKTSENAFIKVGLSEMSNCITSYGRIICPTREPEHETKVNSRLEISN